MSPQSVQPPPKNTALGSLVAALYMIAFAATALLFLTGAMNPKTHVQRPDITTTCSIWHMLASSPDAHPSAELTSRMTILCG